MTEGIDLPNQVVIRTPGEKETKKYLMIFEPDTIKHEEMKEFKKKKKRQKITRDKIPSQEHWQKLPRLSSL